MKGYKALLFLALLAFLIAGCDNTQTETAQTVESLEYDENDPVLFTLLSVEESGIDFTNNIIEDDQNHIFEYSYMYNGGGVAIGDVNNDGYEDIYFTGNMVENKLYINNGDMSFKDITASAGVAAKGSWCTGVTMIDINNDGYLDIYVCRSYFPKDSEKRKNLLYINNGDLTFTEKAAEYGLDNDAHSTQSAFFDYDKDGDLDMYLANHPSEFYLDNEVRVGKFHDPKHKFSNTLYENVDGKFVDVTEKTGVLSYGYSLGVGVSDLNNDGWPDIYVANDYREPDFYLINQKDGTFKESLKEHMKHTSFFGMGADLSDFNNDGYLDIVVVDMLAEDNYRQKTMMPSMNTDLFWQIVDWGYHYQYMHNTFQINNGNGSFSEIAKLTGVANTDWSWAALMADFDNDGFKDLYITNGFRRDARNVDYRAELDEMIEEGGGKIPSGHIQEVLDLIPVNKISNYYFRNNRDLTFTKKTVPYGLDEPSFSNGAAYADLDNDGDLDIIVNNLTSPAFIFVNNCNEVLDNNFLQIQLKGIKTNASGIGTKVTLIFEDGSIQYQELSVCRGFQSCVQNILHFGYEKDQQLTTVHVEWLDGKVQDIIDPEPNQKLVIYQKDAGSRSEPSQEIMLVFSDITDEIGFEYTHSENSFNDFKVETLLPHKMSQFGPNISVGDVNGDGMEDFFVGGASWQSSELYLQNTEGSFALAPNQAWFNDKVREDLGSLFFDCDNDGDLDLYVVSGGNEFSKGSQMLQDRLYLNDGLGNFIKSKGRLPKMRTSGKCVVAGDYDNDGDIDLFVGGRLIPLKYPFSPRSYILQNNGGVFTDVTKEIAPDMTHPGMVTSALWTDFDGDGQLDLIIVGEWMPISFYKNEGGKFINKTEEYGFGNSRGWWNKIVSADFDKDGDQDYVIGNLGLNYKYKASEREPFSIYCYDFDESGNLDIVLGYYNSGVCYPLRGRECSSGQMPFIKEKFKNYDKFGSATLEDVYGSNLDEALHYEATNFSSSYMENKGNGEFVLHSLPVEAQFSYIFGMLAEDFDDDGNQDVLLAGNFYVPEVETGRADASIGL